MGSMLMDAALEGLRRLGYRSAFLWVLEDNARARGFYEHGGWRDSHEARIEEIGGKELRELKYAIDLS